MILPLDAIDILAQNWPGPVAALIIMAGFCLVVWKVTQLYYKKIKPIEDKTAHSDCKVHATKIDSLGETSKAVFKKIDSFDEATKAVLKKIDFIEKVLVAKDPDMLNAFSQAKSPRQLNPRGNKLMSDSGADKILDERRGDLIRQIESLSPNTAYDVEQYAYKVLIGNSSESWFNPLKEFVFNTPSYEKMNINIETICFVMSLGLRNYYFDSHKEIDPEDGTAK